MPTLTPTKKAFLEEVLKVKPKKKGLTTRGPGDDNVQATDAFKVYRKTEEAIIKKIASFDKYTDTDSEKKAFETRVKTIQDDVATTNKNDAKAAKSKFTAKESELLNIGVEVEKALANAELRSEFRKERTKAEELLNTLTGKQTTDMTFHGPLKSVVDKAKIRKGDETPDAATQLKTEAKQVYDTQTAKVGEYTKYVTALAKAEANLVKLKALNRGAHTYDGPLFDIIAEAKSKIATAKANSAQDDDIADANAALAPAEAKYTELSKKATTDRDKDLEAARHKPVYEDKLARVHEAIAELSPLPGTKEAVAKLNELIAKAKPFADAGEFEKAFSALKGLSSALKDGQKAAEQFHATAGGTACAKPLAKAEEALRAFTDVAGLAQTKVVDDARKKLDSILHTLDQPNPHKSVVDDMIDKVNALALELKSQADQQKLLRTAADSAYEKANTMFGELKMKAPLSVWEPRREQSRAAGALLGIQQYDTAKTDFDTLIAAMTEDHKTATANFTKWETLLKEYETKKPVLEEAINVPNTSVATIASSVDSVFRTLPAEMVRTHDYAKGCTEAQLALNKMPEVTTRLANYKKIADEMRAGDQEVNAKVKDVREAVESHADCDLNDFLDQITPLVAAWKQEVNTLFASGKKVADVKNQTITGLAKIISDIDIELQKPGENARRVQQATDKKLQATFNLAKNQAAAAIHTLSEDDLAKSAIRQKEWDVIVQRIAGQAGLQKADVVAMNKVKEDADKDAKAFQDKVEKIKQEAEKIAAQLETELKALEKSNKDYKEYFTELRDRISDCRGMYESSIVTVAEKGKLALEKVSQEIAAVKTNNTRGSGSAETFSKVEDKIKEIKKLIEKSDVLEKCLPSKHGVLKFRIGKDIPDETKKVSPHKALTEVLHKFEEEVNQAIVKAGEAKAKRTTNEQTATRLKTELQKLTDAPKLKASFTNRIEAAIAPSEGGEDKAKLDLLVIEQLIVAAIDDADGRVAMERKATEDEFLAKEAVKQWEAKSDVFKKNAKRKADAAYEETPEKDRNKGLYKEIGDLFKEAEKQADKGAHLVALKKLEQATDAAERFAANPLGGAATARSNLRKVNEDWRRAVADFVGHVNEMSKNIDTENKENPKADVTKIKAQLTRVRKLFDPQIFAPFIGTLTDEEADVPAQRTAKEQALRFVREYRKTIKGDKVLSYLSKNNPFLPAFSTKFLEAKINQLELNLLRE